MWLDQNKTRENEIIMKTPSKYKPELWHTNSLCDRVKSNAETIIFDNPTWIIIEFTVTSLSHCHEADNIEKKKQIL